MRMDKLDLLTPTKDIVRGVLFTGNYIAPLLSRKMGKQN